MAHTVIPPPRGTTATLELTHKRNINDKTIPERDREVRDFNVTLFASAITSRRHLVIDTHRTDLGVTRQGCHHIHEMIVTTNRTCVLLASEDMITQRIDAHLAGTKRATVSVDKHLGDGRSETPAEKSLPNVWWETSYRLLLRKVRHFLTFAILRGKLMKILNTPLQKSPGIRTNRPEQEQNLQTKKGAISRPWRMKAAGTLCLRTCQG